MNEYVNPTLCGHSNASHAAEERPERDGDMLHGT